jgi:hypothetical protein
MPHTVSRHLTVRRCSYSPQSLFAFDIVGYDFIFMAWSVHQTPVPPRPSSPSSLASLSPHVHTCCVLCRESVFYTVLVLSLEYIQARPAFFTFFSRRVIAPVSDSLEEDADVKAERARLQALMHSPNPVYPPIAALGLRKVYGGRGGVGTKVAVHDLWMSVERGECLGFLGINGAGKTSSLKMLTAELYPSTGDARLAQMHLLTQQLAIKEKIGFATHQHKHTQRDSPPSLSLPRRS